MRLDVCSFFIGDVCDSRVRRIISNIGDPNAAISGMVGLIGIESNTLAVVRPCRSPGFKTPFSYLNSLAALGRDDVEMIPTVNIREKRDPFAVR